MRGRPIAKFLMSKQAKDRLGTIPHSILQMMFLHGNEAIKWCHI